MTHRLPTRRSLLLCAGATALLSACGDDAGDGDGGSAGSGNAGSGNAGGTGNAGGGTGATGNTGGVGAGGMGGGGPVGACSMVLVVMGSNYAEDPHDLTIPLEDVQAGVTKVYTTTGTDHTHKVTLTDADFAALANGETVKKYACYNSPAQTDHEWVISCANPDVMPTFEGDFATQANCPG